MSIPLINNKTMDGILENLIAILVFSAIMGIAAFFIIRHFKNMPKRTEALLDSAYELETVGIKRNASGYGGTYKNYLVSIYATASNMGHGRLRRNSRTWAWRCLHRFRT